MSRLAPEIVEEESRGRVRRRLRLLRRWCRRHPALFLLYKSLVTVLGGTFVLAGLVMLVAPGPGWLVIFLGLGVWGTEFHWARRLNRRIKNLVTAWWHRGQERAAQRRHRRALVSTCELLPGPRHLRAPGA